MLRPRVTSIVCVLCLTGLASAQNVQQRIAEIRRQQAIDGAVQQMAANQRVGSSLNAGIAKAPFGEMSARQAFDWLATVSGLPLVINWEKLGEEGIDEKQNVTLPVGADITVARALDMLVKQIAVDNNLLWEPTPWYVEILTKNQANLRTTVITYPIGDLLHVVPQFDNAPDFDLTAITNSSGGSKGGGSGSGDLFGDTSNDKGKDQTAKEKGEELARIIRDTIEPDLWRANGGNVCSITYFDRSLIIRAPAYVHRQIGGIPAMPAAAVNAAPVPGIGVGVVLPDPQVSVVQQGTVLDAAGAADYTGRYVTFTTGFSSATVTGLRQVTPGTVTTQPNLSARPYQRGNRDAGIAPRVMRLP
ncbi:MAG: hypothetical protein GC162_04970 [Planctomycetes bacterium]|nr:hypothetical protein [Planctomycetota bacterium]